MSSRPLKNASSPSSLPKGTTIFPFLEPIWWFWMGKIFSTHSQGNQKLSLPNPALSLTYRGFGQLSGPVSPFLDFPPREVNYTIALWLLSSCSFLGGLILVVRTWRAVECHIWTDTTLSAPPVFPTSRLFSPYQGIAWAEEHQFHCSERHHLTWPQDSLLFWMPEVMG